MVEQFICPLVEPAIVVLNDPVVELPLKCLRFNLGSSQLCSETFVSVVGSNQCRERSKDRKCSALNGRSILPLSHQQS